MSTKFKVDENLPNEATDRLRQLGYDALSVFDQGLNGHPDSDVSAVCRQEERVLITLDRDFGNILNYPPADHSGIMVLGPLRNDKPHVLSLLEKAIAALQSEPIDGNLWIVEDAQIRIR
jgi:predicted nuclease of predicted toxin-antitoxin system